jgi:hypothetical protein
MGVERFWARDWARATPETGAQALARELSGVGERVDLFALKPWLKKVVVRARDKVDQGLAGQGFGVALGDTGAWMGRVKTIVPLIELEEVAAPLVLPKKEASATRVSRAARKFLEAAHTFRRGGVEVGRVGHWLEVGAAPGGMTAELLRLGGAVTAIDRVGLDPRVADHGRLRFVAGDAATVEHPGGLFDGYVSDMNDAPARILGVFERWVGKLEPASPVMINLKLPEWGILWDELDRARETLARRGVRLIDVRHLLHHRQEVGLFGITRGSSA